MEHNMNYCHVVQKNRKSTLERSENFISSHLFQENNLLGRLYPEIAPLVSIQHYPSPTHITYAEAIKAEYKATSVGQNFGFLWSTHWFRLDIEIPRRWEGKEVHLLWGSNGESLVWRDSCPVQGLTLSAKKVSHVLTRHHSLAQPMYCIYIEMAGCGLHGSGDGSLISPPNNHQTFQLQRAEIAVFDREVYELINDFEVINGMARALSKDSERGERALYTANAMVNVCDTSDPSTYPKARALAAKFLSEQNGDGQHVVYAVGHCHIDSAWLWPYSESIRKCGRSWASTVALMKEYSNFNFVASSAQQFTWVMQHYPTLFDEIKSLYAQGRFIPVGGSWVEMDGNMPNGESLIRQFYYGQKFFMQHFSRCQEFWLPDTFGYSGQIPQIMRMFGLRYFLTQKLSWSLFNKFPHHSFWWEGIDGSTVLTHFPPGDSYAMECHPHELIKTVSNFNDKGRSRRSLFLFGNGDGGQGPSCDMIERLGRMKNVDGLPRVEMSTPLKFFSDLETEDGANLCRWVGELYLELHNGTYTTQAQVKSKNREVELRLQALEAIATIAWAQTGGRWPYPRCALEKLWHKHLLNQFHDVLPGSSIQIVYDEVKIINNDIIEKITELMTSAAASTDVPLDKGGDALLFNTRSWPYVGVVTVPPALQHKHGLTTDLAMVHVPSYGYSKFEPKEPSAAVTVFQIEDGFCFTNQIISSKVNLLGQVTELVVLADPLKRNVFAGAGHHGNQFVLYDDQPLYWDAWDIMHYHNEKRQILSDITSPPIITQKEPLRAAITFTLRISDVSQVTQTISLDADSPYLSFTNNIEWRESRKLLKVEFGTNIRAMDATYETQFGHVTRPTHYNTSWDVAKFEVCCHKWCDLSEHGFGMSLINNTRYGCSTTRNVMKLSLLKSSKAPDAQADMGHHTVRYALMPHLGRSIVKCLRHHLVINDQGSFQEAGVIQRSYEFNWSSVSEFHPLRDRYRDNCKSYVTIDTPQVILDTLSMHLDDAESVSLRFYESYGGSTSACITLGFNVVSVYICDGYGDWLQKLPLVDSRFTISVGPFEIVSVVAVFKE